MHSTSFSRIAILRTFLSAYGLLFLQGTAYADTYFYWNGTGAINALSFWSTNSKRKRSRLTISSFLHSLISPITDNSTFASTHIWVIDIRIVIAILLPLFYCCVTFGQQSYTWKDTVNSSAWLVTSNWNPIGAPGEKLDASSSKTDLASIGEYSNNVGGSGIGINMNMNTNQSIGYLAIGGIDFFPSVATNGLSIGNSSSTKSGYLILNGAAINTVSNTLICVRGSRDLTIQNFQGNNNSQLMNITLGIKDGVFQIAANRTLTISSIIGERALNSGFSLQGYNSGSGSLQLIGANTYSGATTIAAGTLLAANSAGSATGTGNVIVQAGGTLGGGAATNPSGTATPNFSGTSGFLTGSVSVQSGATLAPGVNGPGTLTVGETTLDDGSTFRVAIGSSNIRSGSAPSLNDVNTNSRLKINGNFTILANATLTVDGVGQSFTAGQTYDYFLAYWTGSGPNLSNLTINPINFGDYSSPANFSLSQQGNSMVLTFTPVPEPVLISALFLAFAGGYGWLSRRASNYPPSA